MDLGAYAQIDDLEKLAIANGIVVPRLRGYRLMSEEKPISDEELVKMLKDAEIQAGDDWCKIEPSFSMNSFCYEYSSRTRARMERYLIRKTEQWEYGPHRETVGIRWDRIHGKRRKVLKYMIKKSKKAIMENTAVWNRYAGKDNVLYVHARIGGGNWAYYDGPALEKQPWFLEKVDDWFDSTYCDIYAQVNVIEEAKE